MTTKEQEIRTALKDTGVEVSFPNKETYKITKGENTDTGPVSDPLTDIVKAAEAL